MDEGECGSSGVWSICSDITLEYLVLSVYYWYCLQVGLFDVAHYISVGMDWSLDQIEGL